MMATGVDDLLIDLARLGIALEASDDRLRYRPRAAMTPALIERLKTHKVGLLAILRPPVAPEATDGRLTASRAELTGCTREETSGTIPWEDTEELPEPCAEHGQTR